MDKRSNSQAGQLLRVHLLFGNLLSDWKIASFTLVLALLYFSLELHGNASNRIDTIRKENAC